MKKKLIGILVCMMMLALIPAAAGFNCKPEQTETKPLSDIELDDLFGRTVIRGVVLFPRATRNGDFKFFAVRIHYNTLYMGGVKSGTIVGKSITLSNIPNGFIGSFYLFGSFRGNLDQYTT